MSIVNDKTGAVLDQALNLRFKRQQLLTANLANVDTPNYRPVDLAFEGALKEAINKDDSADPHPPGFDRTNAMHMSGWIEEPREAAESTREDPKRASRAPKRSPREPQPRRR